MSDPLAVLARHAGHHRGAAAAANRRRRHRAETRFKAYGIAAICFALLSLGVLLWTVAANGATAFWQTSLRFEITFNPDHIAPAGTTERERIRDGNFRDVLLDAIEARFPDVASPPVLAQFSRLISEGAETQLRDMVLADPTLIGRRVHVWLHAHSDVDMIMKGHAPRPDRGPSRLNDRQWAWITAMERAGDVTQRFNHGFFTGADSSSPELAGVLGGVVASAMTLAICLVLAFPLGVMASVYLEEFAPRNRFTEIVEININNLAAVPSIVFGLLGLAVLLDFFGMTRSSPMVGGTVLALMSLPTIIIAARAALRAVPPSIREAALGIGASKMQMVLHHVLPLAMPGVLTGTIIAMAHALGETAPLLMIGMNAFITDIPQGPFNAASPLPVQIFIWADRAERGYVEKTSAAIMVLLVFMLAMNALAVALRKRFERRW